MRLAVAGHPPPLLVDGETVSEALDPDPILGAFEEAEWDIVRTRIEPGQQLVIVTDGITEARGPTERFGEARLRAQLSRAGSSAFTLQLLEESLRAFTERPLEDDVAALVIAPEPHSGREGLGDMDLVERSMIERLYECFNQRDEGCIVELCDDSMEFFPAVTAEAVGREAPYQGRAGLRDYLTDVARVWEELRIAADDVEVREGRLLVRGRVYARSRELGIRNLPVSWIWEVRDGRFVRGAVFPDPQQAVLSFASRGTPQSAG